MQRYQDLIERYLTAEISSVYGAVSNAGTIQDIEAALPELPVTSALNGKYIIIGADYPPVRNPYAKGNAWFVENAVAAATPDEEIELIGAVDLGKTAVIGKDFEWAERFFADAQNDRRDAQNDREDAHSVMSSEVETSAAGNTDSIELTVYAPNELRYTFSTSAERAAIFSEIYYPKGWKAWIEPAGAYGEVRKGHYLPTPEARPVELFRADWILRGAIIPAGEGELIMRFEPDSYQVGENISRASSIVLILLLVASATGMILNSKRRKED